MRRAGTMLAMALVTMFGGCVNDKSDVLPPPIINTPLPVDPLDEHEIKPWWAGEDQLLRLDENGSYAYYEGTNRHRSPAHRGRWSRVSYASIRLEPYSEAGFDPLRIAVTREGGRLAMRLGDHAPMFGLDKPPWAPEDVAVGVWISDEGRLDLGHDGEYCFYPHRAFIDAAVRGHFGRWRVEGNEVILESTSGLSGTVQLELGLVGTTTLLISDTETFRRWE